MRIFVTGATGFIGSAVVRELIANGHQVIGLSRSREKAGSLAAAGAEVVEGLMEDTDLLTSTAARSDGVIHLAFNHDFSRFAENCKDDRRVIAALAAGLAGSSRPLVVTSGTPIAQVRSGEPAREDNPIVDSAHHPRAHTEEAGIEASAQGVNVSVVRLPQVHDPDRQGLISPLIDIYREKGVCAYLGDGGNRWPAAHVLDVARLYRLVVERAEPGAKYHAVAEEGVSLKDVAETIGQRLALPTRSLSPEEAKAFFGWLGMFAGYDMPASSEATRKKLGWEPSGPGLLADLSRLQLAAA